MRAFFINNLILKIMKTRIENFIAKCVCKGIEMYMRKYRIYTSNDELIPMSDDDFKKELIANNEKEFCDYYFKRFDRYRI